MNVYIAGAFESKDRLKVHRDELAAIPGIKVVSTWLDEESTNGEVAPGLAVQYAIRDLQEVATADLHIIDTFDLNTRGGREFETGIAYRSGAQVWRVGPPRNVFHRLLPEFGSWAQVLALLSDQGGPSDAPSFE
jgi:hypothetical protein